MSEMYPMDGEYLTERESFASLREAAENASDVLNYPISWFFHDETSEDWGKYLEPGEVDKREFSLTFLMPRKSRTWAIVTGDFDHDEVQEWLDTFIKGEVLKWYGWNG